MPVQQALAWVREGRLDEAVAELGNLTGQGRVRVELAIALKRGESAKARELAAALWHACQADATVLAALIAHKHPDLKDPAGELLLRRASDAAFDVSAAYARLETEPEDLEAWRAVLANLVSRGLALDAVDGVARALSERIGGFRLWALLATLVLADRHRSGLLATIELGARAFPHAAEVHAIATLVHLGLGDLDSARNAFASIGSRHRDHPLILAAAAALDEATMGNERR